MLAVALGSTPRCPTQPLLPSAAACGWRPHLPSGPPLACMPCSTLQAPASLQLCMTCSRVLITHPGQPFFSFLIESGLPSMPLLWCYCCTQCQAEGSILELLKLSCKFSTGWAQLPTYISALAVLRTPLYFKTSGPEHCVFLIINKNSCNNKSWLGSLTTSWCLQVIVRHTSHPDSRWHTRGGGSTCVRYCHLERFYGQHSR